jgi:hypothetical protein
MPDDDIKAVLKRAADDPAFMQALLADREAALSDLPLEAHERKMLLAVPDDQLNKMVDRTRGSTFIQSVVRVGCVTTVAAAALAVVALPHMSRGIRPEVREEMTAFHTLEKVAVAEAQYRSDCGRYGLLDDLTKRHFTWPELRGLDKYTFDITITGDTFTATARHKERPDTRKAFTVGPDGQVKEIVPETKKDEQ